MFIRSFGLPSGRLTKCVCARYRVVSLYSTLIQEFKRKRKRERQRKRLRRRGKEEERKRGKLGGNAREKEKERIYEGFGELARSEESEG